MNGQRNVRSKPDCPPRRALYQLLAVLVFIALLASPGRSEELEMINRPVNISGLTGLLITTGPFTIPYKAVEVGIGAFSEKSTRPDYSLNQLPSVTVTTGLSERSEITIGWSYVQKVFAESRRERGTGNPTLAGKYTILPQAEESWVPAVALLLAASGGGDKDINLNGIVHWGARVGLATGKEISFGDHVLGLYADGQLVVHDLNNDTLRDRYGLLNAGILFPISKNRNLQMLVEYSISTGIDRINAQGGDYSALLYGLRLVTERFNLSIGSQFIRKQVEGFENSNGVTAVTSLKF
jgi:hypothetical protein